MSDPTSLTVPDPGWYADRNDANTVRWWDGSQWTDHTHSVAPEQNVAQPVSAAAFGFTPVEPNPLAAASPSAGAAGTTAAVASVGQTAPGWYPDNADPALQRWWDGTQWTSHTAPRVAIPTPTPGSYLGASTTPISPAVNALATRGMIYSLIGLVLNPFLIMSIGGLVNGIRAMRRVPQFAPENARRGSAIAAIAVGSVATVLSLVVVGAAIAIPLIQSQQPRTINQSHVQQQLLSDLSTRFQETVASVSCPASTVVKKGNVFTCTATLADGETLEITGTFATDAGDYSYVTHELDPGVGSTAAETPPSSDAGTGDIPYTLPMIKQDIASDFSARYDARVSGITCDPQASMTEGSQFLCAVALDDGRVGGVKITMLGAGGYEMSIVAAPEQPAPDDSDVSHS